MIGLVVQIAADLVQIWSTSSRRFHSYGREDVPEDIREGDWIEMKQSGAAFAHVLDFFLLEGARAFSETFGVVTTVGESGGDRWTEAGGRSADHCFLLWATISAAGVVLERQSLDRAYPRDGPYSGTFRRLKEQFEKEPPPPPPPLASSTRRYLKDFDETILIVGRDPKSNRLFSTSRSGEAFINESVWSRMGQVEMGAVFRARMTPVSSPRSGCSSHFTEVGNVVVHLYARVLDEPAWPGVHVECSRGRDVKVTLDARVAEKRATCYALETEPFGLVTYPLNRNFLKAELVVGDWMRVRLCRYKAEYQDDHPSKLQVVSIVAMLERRNEEERTVGRDRTDEEWTEGVVVHGMSNKVFIECIHGYAKLFRDACSLDLVLGTIVDVQVEPGDDDSLRVRKVGGEARRRGDIKVEMEHEKPFVICPARVVEKRQTHFLLDTPIIGPAMFHYEEAPREMRVGEQWEVRMSRRKNKGYSSYWVASEVTARGRIRGRSREDEERREGGSTVSSAASHHSSSRDRCSDDEWTTVLLTGHNVDLWYGSCARADPVRIPPEVTRSAAPGTIRKGAFFRIRFARKADGHLWAYDIENEPVYPRDVEVIEEPEERNISLWCYSSIVAEEGRTAFTVRNELIGDATLPLSWAPRAARVGDRLETLYYRVKSTANPTQWMVRKARLAAERGGGERVDQRPRDEDRSTSERGGWEAERDHRKTDEASECRGASEERKGVVDARERRPNRRAIEIMAQMMEDPPIYYAIKDNEPAAAARISEILARNL